MRWQVELQGDPVDTELLRALFQEPDLHVLKEGDIWILEAKELENLATAQSVYSFAKRIVTRLNGAVRLRSTTYRNVEVGHVHERRGEGNRATHAVVEAATIRARTTVFPVTIATDGNIRHVESVESKFERLARTDSDVREALDLLANKPHDWVNLYKLFEIVDSRGGASLAVSKTELRRFKHTANHQGAAGGDARHARMTTKPPTNPMSLFDAEQLIGALLEDWLESLT